MFLAILLLVLLGALIGVVISLFRTWGDTSPELPTKREPTPLERYGRDLLLDIHGGHLCDVCGLGPEPIPVEEVDWDLEDISDTPDTPSTYTCANCGQEHPMAHVCNLVPNTGPQLSPKAPQTVLGALKRRQDARSPQELLKAHKEALLGSYGIPGAIFGPTNPARRPMVGEASRDRGDRGVIVVGGKQPRNPPPPPVAQATPPPPPRGSGMGPCMCGTKGAYVCHPHSLIKF